MKQRHLWPVVLIIAGITLILAFLFWRFVVTDGPNALIETAAEETRTTAVPSSKTPPNTRTPSPLLPTSQPIIPSPEPDPQPTETTVLLTITPESPTAPCSPEFCIPRFGASGRIEHIAAAHEASLPFGVYFNWEMQLDPIPAGSAEFWQMIRVSQNGIRQEWAAIAPVIEANPGSVWIIGNEPDIIWQDNTTAEKYAELYHDAYTFIKEADSTAHIAVAGVGQPSPLRLAYLDVVLETYEQSYGTSMPVDIWTIHNFILREERDSWGVGIPPGFIQESGEPVNEGILYEISDHNDLAVFRQNLFNFRQWMADRGYRDRPLAVTEFGILMPSDFGFPPPVVAEFLTGTLDFLVQATDDTIGYPADENRLVQWAFWYSVYDPLEFPTGNLYEPETGQLTALGEIYTDYINGN
jgi:hypothetical protein